MNSLSRQFSHNKYRLMVFGLLAGASVVCVGLVRYRATMTDSTYYAFLIWNLFLAWIPFVFATLAYAVSWTRRLLYIVLPVCAFVWLIFFPNAPYILTDFQHLTETSTTAPLWYDVLLLIWFAWTGLMLGVTSLHMMQEIVTRLFGRLVGWIFAAGVTVLSSAGIALGRFYRWNSWDIINDPLPIAQDIYGWLRHPFSNLRTYGFTLLFTLLFFFVYLAFHTFGRMMEEGRAKGE